MNPKGAKKRLNMTRHGSDPISEVRRHETISGSQITIIIRGKVETVRGGPKCRWCRKPLRPKYSTERAPSETHHYYEQRPENMPAVFDEKRKQWLVKSVAYQIVSRKFEGSFGTYADNHFCGLNCGRDYAIAVLAGISSKTLRLIDMSGNDADVSAGTNNSAG
jgi:hypothetical protein